MYEQDQAPSNALSAEEDDHDEDAVDGENVARASTSGAQKTTASKRQKRGGKNSNGKGKLVRTPNPGDGLCLHVIGIGRVMKV